MRRNIWFPCHIVVLAHGDQHFFQNNHSSISRRQIHRRTLSIEPGPHRQPINIRTFQIIQFANIKMAFVLKSTKFNNMISKRSILRASVGEYRAGWNLFTFRRHLSSHRKWYGNSINNGAGQLASGIFFMIFQVKLVIGIDKFYIAVVDLANPDRNGNTARSLEASSSLSEETTNPANPGANRMPNKAEENRNDAESVEVSPLPNQIANPVNQKTSQALNETDGNANPTPIHQNLVSMSNIHPQMRESVCGNIRLFLSNSVSYDSYKSLF